MIVVRWKGFLLVDLEFMGRWVWRDEGRDGLEGIEGFGKGEFWGVLLWIKEEK